MDTIYAPATPLGGALCILRISGPEAHHALECVFAGDVSRPRYMAYGRLLLPALADAAMAVRFCAPASYTGEDMAELYIHGGQGVTRATLGALAHYARMARPGEFTQRAFLNGKLDLSQAEAVMDVINARGERAAQAAAAQLAGGLGARIRALEDMLLKALSTLDATIDYPDEMQDEALALPPLLQEALAETEFLIENGLRARVLREGLCAVLAGRPNAGKSSLLNALLGSERAIVTAQAGTTRDLIEESLIIDGLPVRLVDTAGLRASAEEAEQEGVARARAAMAQAELLLCCFDGSMPLCAEDKELLQQTRDKPRLLLLCKSDLPMQSSAADFPPGETPLRVSARTGAGLEALREAIAGSAQAPESVYVTNTRHIAALQSARAALQSALEAQDMDCAATDLREALLSLGEITGSSVDEAVLERIFAAFCVGK